MATQGGSLVRFSGFDLSARPACDPTPCAMPSTQLALALPQAPPSSHRNAWAGAELFVTTAADAGSTVTARRSASGTWSAFNSPGTIVESGTSAYVVRFDADAGVIVRELYDPATGTFVNPEIVDSTQTQVWALSGADDYVGAIVGPGRTPLVKKRSASTGTFAPVTLNLPVGATGDLTALRINTSPAGLAVAGLETASGRYMIRLDASGNRPITTAGVQGWDFVWWGNHQYVTYAQNGDVFLKLLAGSNWSGASFTPVNFGGPPRSGYAAPFPVTLDASPTCEAAWPHLEFVEEALVVTWQERCAPATQWRVVARAVR